MVQFLLNNFFKNKTLIINWMKNIFEKSEFFLKKSLQV